MIEPNPSILNVSFLIKRLRSERSKIMRNSPGVRLGTGKIWERNFESEGETTFNAPSNKSSLTLALVIGRESEE